MGGKLESLRGIAACLVVLFHSPFSFGDTPLRFISNSYLFVDLFFILSGFVISYAYEKKILEGLGFKTFFAIRLGRIYPLHIFMLLAFVAYTGLKVFLYNLGFGSEQEFDKNNIYSFASNLMLVHSLGVHDYLSWNFPSWSISVEFFTYIIFYLNLKYLEKKPAIITPIVMVLFGYVWLSMLQRSNLDITYDYGLVRCVFGFYLGVLLYRTREKTTLPEKYRNVAEVISFILVVVAVSYAHNNWYFQILSIASFVFVIYVFSQSGSGVIGNMLHVHVVRSVGVWSYSIYMTHALILSVATSFSTHVAHIDASDVHGWKALIINVILLFVIVFVSRFTFSFIEDNFRRKVKEKIGRQV